MTTLRTMAETRRNVLERINQIRSDPHGSFLPAPAVTKAVGPQHTEYFVLGDDSARSLIMDVKT